ncbi:MAG: translocation/assembly module TamB domain-containing protein [Vulcanimicrobiaceae bacterium]
MTQVRKPNRMALAMIGAIVVGLVMLGATRDVVARGALEAIVGPLLGDTIRVASVQLTSSRLLVRDVRVTRGRTPILTLPRLDMHYTLRGLLPGSGHRFGLTDVVLDRPRLRIVRSRNGSYDIPVPSAIPAGPSAPKRPNGVPFRLRLQVLDGSLEVDDHTRLDPAARRITLSEINLRAGIDSVGRTTYMATARFRRPSGGRLRAAGTIDRRLGYARNRLVADRVPLQALVNYAINSSAVRIEGGQATHLLLRSDALGVKPHAPIDYLLSGSVDVSGARLALDALARPIDGFTARIHLVDNAIFSRHIDADIAGVPVRANGAVFGRATPQFRLAMAATGNLGQLKTAFAFTQTRPLHGRVHLRALLEGPVDAPVLLIAARASQARYAHYPLRDVVAHAAVSNNVVTLWPAQARFDGVPVVARGAFLLGAHLRTHLALRAAAPARRFPYVAQVLHRPRVSIEATAKGLDGAFDVHGTLFAANATAAGALFSFDGKGRGSVGPFYLRSPKGFIEGGYRLDRPAGSSALWLDARHLALHAPAGVPMLDAGLVQLPPINGSLGQLSVVAATGPARVLAGRLSGGPATFEGLRFGAVTASFAGDPAGANLDMVRANGPWGNFAGHGMLGSDGLTLRGKLAARLAGLHGILAGWPATGDAAGELSLAFTPGRVVIQSDGLRFTNARVHGVPVQRALGTVEYADGGLRVDALRATVAGGEFIAAGRLGATAKTKPAPALDITALGVQAADLGAFGLPLQRGRLWASGTVLPGRPRPGFQGVVVLRAGRYGTFGVGGTAHLAFDGRRLTVERGIGYLGPVPGFITGHAGLSGSAPAYAFQVRVPEADLASTLHAFALPSDRSQASIGGDLRLDGLGTQARLAGPVRLGAGSINGLPFVDGAADLRVASGTVAAANGIATFGSTRVHISGAYGSGGGRFSFVSRRADLSDFDNFFDTGCTLAGTGSIRVGLAFGGRRVASNAAVDIQGLRYLALPIGNTRASWLSRRNTIVGSLDVGGTHGLLRANGSILAAKPTSLAHLVMASTYNVNANLSHLDLSTWLPALGFPQVPLLGRLDAHGDVRGRYPALAGAVSAKLDDGVFRRVPIRSLRVSLHSRGSRVEIVQADLVTSALDAQGSGSFGLGLDDPLKLEIHASTDSLAHLLAQTMKTNLPVAGHFEATASVTGTPHSPHFRGAVDARNAAFYGVPVASLFGAVVLHGRRIEVKDAGVTFVHGSATLAGTLPLQLDPFRLGPSGSPISLDVAVQNLDPATFASLLGPGAALAGSVNGHVGIGGSVASPQLFGEVTLSGGRYSSNLERVPIAGASARLQFARSQATLTAFAASMGAGRITARGRVAFSRGMAAPEAPSYRLDAVAQNAGFNVPNYAAGSVDAKLTLKRALGAAPTLRGAATFRDTVIPFSAFLAAGSQSVAGGLPPGLAGLKLHLDLQAASNVQVRGNGYGAGLDFSGRGGIQVAGTLGSPRLDGKFTATSGTVTYFDRAFRLQRGTLSFTPEGGLIPTIRAVGSTHVVNPDPNRVRNPYGTADIRIAVRGPVNHLAVSFSSNPPGYTRDQIIALLAPLGGFVNGIAFDAGNPVVGIPNASIQTLRGAPAPGTGALLPGVLTQSASGSITVGEEAFNILNAQFTSGVLAPLENVLGSGLGLGSVGFSVDYYGDVGLNLRRRVSRFVTAIYQTTFGIPARQSFALNYAPNRQTAAEFSVFFTTGPSTLSEVSRGLFGISRLPVGQAIGGQSGFSFTLQQRIK